MRRVTPRFVAYLTVVLLVASAALFSGRVELLAAAAPLVVALVAGLLLSSDPAVEVVVALDRDRCLEGEEVTVRLRLDAGEDMEAEVAVRVPGGFEDPSGGSHSRVMLPADDVAVVLRAERWGTYRVGHVGIRAYGPGRFVYWESIVDGSEPVKVFPGLERIRNAPVPPDTQVFAGNYVSRASGDGIEFSQVRTFQPGDRIRSVNWRVTGRRGALNVNVFHPERNADVVLFLDAFGDFGSPDSGSLELAVRGASGIARRLLRRKDRVGLVSFGGIVRWIDASMNRTQVYRIADTLLESEAAFSYARKEIASLPSRSLPPKATIVAFSPLIDERAIQAIEDLGARGFPLVVVDTLPEALVPPGATPEGRLAHRVWRLKRAADRVDLAARGIPVLNWWEEDHLDAALATLPPLPRLRRSHA